MHFAELALTSEKLAATRSRTAKRDLIATLLSCAAPDERRAVVAWMSGTVLQGKLGIGWAEIGRIEAPPAETPALGVAEVEATFAALATTSGKGATVKRRALLVGLLEHATLLEQGFLKRLMLGELRQGGLEGVMVEGIAKATELEPALVRRAMTLTGDLPTVAALALADGAAGLSAIELRVFTPLSPMLASPSEDLAQALLEQAPALIEWKLDGARVQVHRQGAEVRVYTRALQDVTRSVPEVVEAALALPNDRFVLDGETLAIGPNGSPRPFQETLARFSKKLDIDAARGKVPLSVFFFDVVLLGNEVLLDKPLVERRALLEALVPAGQRITNLMTDQLEAAQVFYADAIERGHEGVMVKALSSTYEAGARGSAWQKVKRVHTLDLVVLAAEWGSGRRHGKLSNLHLGARGPDGNFVMLGKTFKGMTDEILAWQTDALLPLQTRREGPAVFVQPTLVVEMAFDEVQASTQYPGGYALRFARLLRYRPDKTVDQADTIDAVRTIFEHARARQAPSAQDALPRSTGGTDK